MAHEVQRVTRRGEKWFQKSEALNKQNRGQLQSGKTSGLWRSLVGCSNDSKSAGREKDWKIITELLEMRNFFTKMVPRQLNYDHECHMQVCLDNIEHLQMEPDLFRWIISGDKTDFFQYVRTISGSLRHCLGRGHQDRQSQKSVLLITFFDVRGRFQSETLPLGERINQLVFKEILGCMLWSVCERWGGFASARRRACLKCPEHRAIRVL